MKEIKFRATHHGRLYNVSTRKPKRANSKGWYLVHGYRRRLVTEHPFADKRGYVVEHRLVMEAYLGRFLEPTEFVHHLDQDRLNNDISNLELQGSQAEHAKRHSDKIGKRNTHGQFVATEPIFSELKYRLFNKNTKTTRIYSLATLIGITFRRGQFEFRGRFTGLHDKNGKEIYEGDIVKYTRTNWKCPTHPKNNTNLVTICEIFWDETDKSFKNRGRFKSGGGWNGTLSFNDARADENIIEVIGNIYENPELLEVTDASP